jgi:hypothetical protein
MYERVVEWLYFRDSKDAELVMAAMATSCWSKYEPKAGARDKTRVRLSVWSDVQGAHDLTEDKPQQEADCTNVSMASRGLVERFSRSWTEDRATLSTMKAPDGQTGTSPSGTPQTKELGQLQRLRADVR